MAAITEARFDLVASDRTRGAFASVERGLHGIRKSASMMAGALVGGAIISTLRNSVKDVIEMADKGINLVPPDTVARLRETNQALEAMRLGLQAIVVQQAPKVTSFLGTLADTWVNIRANAASFGAHIGARLAGESPEAAREAALKAGRGQFNEDVDAMAGVLNTAEQIRSAEAAASRQKEIDSARESVLSKEIAAAQKLADMELARLAPAEKLLKLQQAQLDAGAMAEKDYANRNQWLVRQLELEEQIEKTQKDMATATGAGPAAAVASRESISTMGFADVVRQAQDYASRAREAKLEKANQLLAQIRDNTAQGGVFA